MPSVLLRTAVLLLSLTLGSAEDSGMTLDGPRAVAALKMAMRKVIDLETPTFLETGRNDKDGLHEKVTRSFHTLLDATQSSWLMSRGEQLSLRQRFERKVWNHQLKPALKQSDPFSSFNYWDQFWLQAKHTFTKAVFQDEKALLKSETQESVVPAQRPRRDPRIMNLYETPGPFHVDTGACEVDDDGCLTSPNWPMNYSNRGSCLVSVNENLTGPLRVMNFSTEDLSDTLTVNGVMYSGNEGPNGIWPHQEIVWFADYMLNSPGFKICPTPPDPNRSLAPLQPETRLWVTQGNCTVDSLGCAMSTNYPDFYPPQDYCVINVSEGGKDPLHVEEFMTELSYDKLIVNNRQYSGDEGPEGQVPSGAMIWSTDFSYNAKGWKICPLTDHDPALIDANNTVFRIRSGECVVDADGCVKSPGYSAMKYPDSSVCTIGVNTETAGPLHVELFDTETNYDVLTVNNMRFSGTRGPQGIIPFEDILWYADWEAAAAGWKICSRARDVNASTVDEDASSALILAEGPCVVDGGCATSPNYPNPYNTSEHCLINVTAGNIYPLEVDDFVTELELDTLIVNGKAFSGIAGPDGVIPNGVIEWTSDPTISSPGWKVCLETPPGQITTTVTTTTTTVTSTTTTTNTTITTTTTTTTTTTASPWDDLQFHMEVSGVMGESLLTLEGHTKLFDSAADNFRKTLEAVLQMPSEQSPLERYALQVNASLVQTFNSWRNFLQALKPSFEALSAAVTKGQEGHGSFWEQRLDLHTQTWDFDNKVLWFVVEMLRQELSLPMGPAEVLPSKLEALKSPIRTFRADLNNFIETVLAAFGAVPSYFKDQVTEPLRFVDIGECADADGKTYDALQTQGCDGMFWCASTCRDLPSCLGFTMSFKQDPNLCPRCKLHVESAAAMTTPPFWVPTVTDGEGRGPIAGTAEAAPNSTVHCFRRAPYEKSSWTPQMRTALEQQQGQQVAKYDAVKEAWIDIVSKLKGAFWKIMSALQDGTSKAASMEMKVTK